MSPWVTTNLPHGVVIRPSEDIILHTYTEECVCYPKVDEVVYTVGEHISECYMAVRKVITHQAMDGRE